MKRIELAPGYTISPIIKGCWQMAEGHGQVSCRPVEKVIEDKVTDLLNFAYTDVTTFDCADIYTGVEDLLGRFREEYARRHGRNALDGIQIHTKFVPDLEALSRINRAYVERIINRSLRRLGMDALDLVQFHWWDWEIPGYVETAGYLADLQRAGKIRHIGVTNFDVSHLTALLDAGIKVVSNQVQYSLIDRRAENGMTALCNKRGVKLLAYGTVAGGFLANRWHHKPKPTGELENRSLVKYKLIIDEFGGWDEFQALLSHLSVIAAGRRVGIAEVATGYVLNKPAVAGVIMGGHVLRVPAIFSAIPDFFEEFWIRYALMGTKKIQGDIYSLERQKNGKHAAIMRYNLNEEK